MLNMAGKPNEMEKNLKSGAGLKKFLEMIKAQGGDMSQKMAVAKYKKNIPAPQSGYIHSIECDKLGFAVITLGGGRKQQLTRLISQQDSKIPRKLVTK